MTEVTGTYDTIKEQDYPDQEILTALEAANVALTTLAVKFDYDSVLGDKEFNEDELGDLKMALIIVGQRENHHLQRRRQWWARRMEVWKETA